MINTILEIIPSPQGVPHDLIENQANSITLLRRRFSWCQLKVSREANGRLRGWVIADETREVKLKGLPIYLNLKRAIQLLNQSYLKFQKEAIEVLPKGLGGGMKYSRPLSAVGSNKAKTCEERALQLVEAISNDDERRVVWKAVNGLLKNDPEKKDLNLPEIQISAAGIQAIETALQVNHTFQSLNFWRNQIGNRGAQALGAALQVNHTLESLTVFNKHIGDTGAQALGAALQVNQSLQSLNLEENNIGAAGAQALGAALQVNQSLQSLNLKWNIVDTAGAQVLGTALQVNQSLQSLHLVNNLIGDAGAQALGTALQVNHTLQSLNLRKNQIGAVGAQALGTALQVNQSLRSLNLEYNLIGVAGAQVLGVALQVNQTIQKLNLSSNRIGDVGIQALEAALQINDTLQVLDFGDNRIGAEGIITEKRIETLLQANKQIAILFQQQITQVQNFFQSHENNDGILLEHLPQLNELLSKWHTDSKNIIPSLQEILRQSGKTDLSDQYKEKLEGIITNLTNRLHDLWLESFEKKIAALSKEYVMGKESSEKRNVDLGYALYDMWLTFLGSDCPNWVKDHIQSLIPFGVLLDIAEGGEKKDVTELTDAHLLFERVFAFRNESKDSLLV